MQQAGDATGEAAVFVVDVGIEQAGFPRGVGWEDVVVGYAGGYEGGVPLSQTDLVARGTDADGAVALDAHGDDEGVVLDEVAVEGDGGVDDAHGEVGGVDAGVGTIDGFVVEGEVLVFDMEVDGVEGLLGVELTGFAVKSRAVVVVDAVGDVAALLHFCQQDAATDGVDATRGQVEDVAWFDGVLGKHLRDAAVGYALPVFVGGDVLFQPCIEVGTWLGVDDVPALGFSAFAMATACQCVVGMYLDAEVVGCVDEFDKEGQFATVLTKDGLSEDVCSVLVYDGNEVLTCQGTVLDDADAGGQGADFPAFADGFVGGA